MTRPTPRRFRTATAARRAAVGTSRIRARASSTLLLQRVAAPAAMAAVAAVAAIAIALVWPAPAAHAAAYDRFYAGFAGEELMRAINADRTALGLPAYATDATLEAIARDRPTTCPTNAGLTIRGRARDMAERGYFGHDIAGCTAADGMPFTAFELLAREGYTSGSPGEDIGSNDYPSSAATYAIGCSITGSSCRGTTTLPWTVAVAERGFMSSTGHRDNLLSTGFDRFGCGAWRSAGGTNLYACYFSSGGNGTIDASGPTISGLSGAGDTFRTGSSVTFSAGFGGGASLLADGYMALDGVHLRNWAWDDTVSGSVTVTTPGLIAGNHTITWWARDASTNSRTASFSISVTGSGGTPRPTATATRLPPPTVVPTSSRGPEPSVAPPAGASSLPGDHPSGTPTPTARGQDSAVPPSNPVGSGGVQGLPTGPVSGSGEPAEEPPTAPTFGPGVAAGGPDPRGATDSILAWLVIGGAVYVAGALVLGTRVPNSRTPPARDGRRGPRGSDTGEGAEGAVDV